MNAGYNNGQALFNLAQAYMGNGDNDNAARYFQRVVDDYGNSEYAEEAQTNLSTLQAEAAANADSGDAGTNGGDGNTDSGNTGSDGGDGSIDSGNTGEDGGDAQ